MKRSGRRLGIIIISFKICFAESKPTTSEKETPGELSMISDKILSFNSFPTTFSSFLLFCGLLLLEVFLWLLFEFFSLLFIL